jgi:predicted acyl esterase
MRFFDRYVKGAKVTTQDPPLAVESSDGKWRSEAAWPPVDSRRTTSPLRTGSFTDDAQNNGTAEGGSPNGQGVWTFSPPLAQDAHLAGVPRVTVDAEPARADANLVVDVYDVDAKNSAILISRGAYLLRGPGAVTFDLYGDDWKLPAGHRLGVLVTGANAEWWAHVPTLGSVTVRSASIRLPFLSCRRTLTIQGAPSIKLEKYRADAPFTVPADTISGATSTVLAVPGTRACKRY